MLVASGEGRKLRRHSFLQGRQQEGRSATADARERTRRKNPEAASGEWSSPAEVPHLEAASLTECPTPPAARFVFLPSGSLTTETAGSHLRSARREPQAPQMQVGVSELRGPERLPQ